ncbi:unnamed protein product [Arctogadus glacialis]
MFYHLLRSSPVPHAAVQRGVDAPRPGPEGPGSASLFRGSGATGPGRLLAAILKPMCSQHARRDDPDLIDFPPNLATLVTCQERMTRMTAKTRWRIVMNSRASSVVGPSWSVPEPHILLRDSSYVRSVLPRSWELRGPLVSVLLQCDLLVTSW